MHVFSLDVFISFVHSRSVSKFTGETFHHVVFKVGTFTNSTNINSHELFKPTCILRYELQHNTQNLGSGPTKQKTQHNTQKTVPFFFFKQISDFNL
jgi:hypothetical protein